MKKTTFWGKQVEYTGDMKLAYAVKAQPPRSQSVKVIAWVYAAVLTVMVVGQLFAFEDFIPLIANYWLPGGNGTASLVGCLIVVTEVFAIPYLLRMPLSPLMRWTSMICGLIVPTIWIKLAITALVTDNALTNSGMLGTKVSIHAGAMQLVFSLLIAVLAIWSAWGLWPARKK